MDLLKANNCLLLDIRFAKLEFCDVDEKELSLIHN